MKSKGWVSLLVLLVFVVAACGGATGAPESGLDSGAPTGESMVDETSDGGISGDDMSDDGSSDDMSGEDMSDEAMADDDMADDDMAPEEEMADGDMADDDMADDGTSDSDMVDDDMADEDMSDDEMADDGAADGDMADDDMSGDEMSDDGTSDDDMANDDMAGDGTSDDMMTPPAWLSAELSDVAMSETFSLADFQGKVVLVELMAIWCPSCLRQQQEVLALHDALGMRDDLVTVALDIDPNEDADSLREYAADHGFDWYYTVAPRDLAREIGQLYGDQFLSPPSTPMLIVDRHGEVHPLPFGLKTAEELEAALEPFLAEEDM